MENLDDDILLFIVLCYFSRVDITDAENLYNTYGGTPSTKVRKAYSTYGNGLFRSNSWAWFSYFLCFKFSVNLKSLILNSVFDSDTHHCFGLTYLSIHVIINSPQYFSKVDKKDQFCSWSLDCQFILSILCFSSLNQK